MRRIAVLGGTFDPVHRGHVSIAEQARDALGADEAWLVPAHVPPWRGEPIASPEQRMSMVRAAVDGRARLRADDIEMRRPGPSYTVDTLGDLGSLHPGSELWLIVGADVAPAIRRWHRAEELLSAGHFAIVNRTGAAPIPDSGGSCWGFPAERTLVLSVASPRISAQDVRARVLAGRPIDDLVLPAVAALISELGVYKLR